MQRLPVTIVADDFTGAAETAAIGLRFGCEAEVTLAGAQAGEAEVRSIDTDTRLRPADAAAAEIRALGAVLAGHPGRFVFKKVDSVLRGNVYAETAALASSLGLDSVLLVPANPSLGRTIAGGRYCVDGIPIDRTSFARDPHHPARSAEVSELLSPRGPVAVRPAGSPGPIQGFTVGEAASAEEVRGWAGRLAGPVLAAGGGEFLGALFERMGRERRQATAERRIDGPALLVAGSTADACWEGWRARRAKGAAVATVPPGLLAAAGETGAGYEAWKAAVAALLERERLVTVAADGPVVAGETLARRIRGIFARLAADLLGENAFRHLLVEGGATAVDTLRRLGWTRLGAEREWSQGSVSLRPKTAAHFLVTVKPGSYVWPQNLLRSIDPDRNA